MYMYWQCSCTQKMDESRESPQRHGRRNRIELKCTGGRQSPCPEVVHPVASAAASPEVPKRRCKDEKYAGLMRHHQRVLGTLNLTLKPILEITTSSSSPEYDHHWNDDDEDNDDDYDHTMLWSSD